MLLSRKNGLHARPPPSAVALLRRTGHPGPLSQGEGGARRRLWKPTRPGVGAASERKGSNATDATEAIELSNSARKFSLSPGERAGVRANLFLTLSFSPGDRGGEGPHNTPARSTRSPAGLARPAEMACSPEGSQPQNCWLSQRHRPRPPWNRSAPPTPQREHYAAQAEYCENAGLGYGLGREGDVPELLVPPLEPPEQMPKSRFMPATKLGSGVPTTK